MLNNEIKTKFEIIAEKFTFLSKVKSTPQKNNNLLLSTAKLWNMDTSILTILETFLKKISEFKKSISETCFDLNIIQIKKDNTIHYKLVYDSENVTPSSKGSVALSTIYQYIRVLLFFDILIINDYENLRDNIEKSKPIKIVFTASFRSLISLSDWNKWFNEGRFIDFITKGLTKRVLGFNDMSYSFFMSLIYYLDSDKFLSNESSYFKHCLSKKNKKINNEFSSNNIHVKMNKILNETYIKLVEKFISILTKNETYENNYQIMNVILNKIIDKIGFDLSCLGGIDDGQLSEIMENYNINKKIQKDRSILRENLLKERNPENNNYYSDLEPINSNDLYTPDCIKQIEAAHIYPVSDIKDKILCSDNELKNKEYYNYLTDYNNGILMDHVYHDAFDRGWLILNYNGEFEPTDEWNKNYKERYIDKDKKIIKYPLVKIKRSVFQDEVKKYINLLNSIS